MNLKMNKTSKCLKCINLFRIKKRIKCRENDEQSESECLVNNKKISYTYIILECTHFKEKLQHPPIC